MIFKTVIEKRSRKKTEVCPNCKGKARRLYFQKRENGNKIHRHTDITFCDVCNLLLLVDPATTVYAKYVKLQPLEVGKK